MATILNLEQKFTAPIPQGQNFVVLAGLDLPFTPTDAQATTSTGALDAPITASVDRTTLSSSGCTVYLSGAPLDGNQTCVVTFLGTAPTPTTSLMDFIPTLRILLNDLNPSVQEFADATLTQGVQSMILLQQLCGYTLSPDQTTILPSFPTADAFALACFKTARLFVTGTPAKYSFKSRAFSESIGSYRDFIMDLDRYIYLLEDGCMFTGWQMFYGFLSGISGLSLLEVFTSMRVNSPFYSITLTATGGTAAS